MSNNKHQRFKATAIEALTALGPATWPEIKCWIWENKKNAGRIVPASGQVGGILASMPEIHQMHTRTRRLVHHTMASSDRSGYAVWSMRSADGRGY